MPEMQALKPCARCEQEIPEAFFEGKDAVFCKRCADEINDILSKKYSVIEAAHFRAQMRLRSKNLQKKLQTQTSNQIAAAGD
ncbi:MAG: hypothetical protein AAF846_09695 [Chloroflexota bacterium]